MDFYQLSIIAISSLLLVSCKQSALNYKGAVVMKKNSEGVLNILTVRYKEVCKEYSESVYVIHNIVGVPDYEFNQYEVGDTIQ